MRPEDVTGRAQKVSHGMLLEQPANHKVGGLAVMETEELWNFGVDNVG